MVGVLRQNYLIFPLFYLQLLFLSFVIRSIYPIEYASYPLFFFDLINYPLTLPKFIIYISNFINLGLVWLISKKIFAKYSFISTLLYSISPWFAYLTATGSSHIYLLTLLLTVILGSFYLKESQRLGISLIVGSIALSIYSSLLMLPVFTMVILISLITKIYLLEELKKILLIIIICLLPLFALAVFNQEGTNNVIKTQINLLPATDLVSEVNLFQGESRNSNLYNLSRISENKYIYLMKYLALKISANISLSTFFTPQGRLLNFSFSPPLFMGFLFPFLYGLFVFSKSSANKYLIVSLGLIFPAIMSNQAPDLNRLVIFSPFILFLTTLGIIRLKEKRSVLQFVFYISTLLVLVQLIVMLFDLNLREFHRFERYFPQIQFEIGKQ